MAVAICSAWILYCRDGMNLIRMQTSVDWGKYRWVYPDKIANVDDHMYTEWKSRKRAYRHVSTRKIIGHLENKL